jgi:uncharacterized membrane protein
MVGPPPSRSDPDRGWHRLVEQYTPDGTVGRVLLALATSSAASLGFVLALAGFATFTLVSTFLALLTLGGALAASLLTVVVLWPVYLSLIGNIDSPADYGTVAAAGTVARDDADATELLKREYAAGNISTEEFERRLDRLLDVEATRGSASQERQHIREKSRPDSERVRETNRS